MLAAERNSHSVLAALVIVASLLVGCTAGDPASHLSLHPNFDKDPTVPRLQEGDTLPEGYDVCSYFASGRKDLGWVRQWGSPNHTVCDTSKLARWRRAARANCYDCANKELVCGHAAPRLLFHMYIENWHPHYWSGQLYSIQAWLMTQDLSRVHLMLWAKDVPKMMNHPANEFIQRFGMYVSWHQVQWPALIQGTVLRKSDFWGNETKVAKTFASMRTPAAFSDVLRILLLVQYGGVWLDNDTVLLHDIYPVTVQVGYQFVMRWMNNHVFYMKRRSALAMRMVDILNSMPWPDTQEELTQLVEKRCKRVGYYPMSYSEYGNQDIYNACVMRYALYKDNKGPDPDSILYDQPLGWWDQDWPSCVKMKSDGYSSQELLQFFDNFMALHTRWPKRMPSELGGPNSFLRRTFLIIGSFFQHCHSPACLPQHGADLITFEDAVVRMASITKPGGWMRRMMRRVV